MSSTVFANTPTSKKNATLYQHALEVRRVVRGAVDRLREMDQQSADVNRAPGEVLVDEAQPVDGLTPSLSGAYSRLEANFLRGQIVDGIMQATLSEGPRVELGDQRIRFQETNSEKIYELDTPARKHYHFHPGKITVREDKAQGTLSIEQQEFPWQLEFTYSSTKNEGKYAATGPKTSQEALLYHQGERLKSQIDDMIAELRNADNSLLDLNPESGVVVVPAFGSVDSDNLVFGHMAGNYKIPLEAELHFDPASGQVTRFAAGFGDKDCYSYERDQSGRESYRRDLFLGCTSLDVQPDGRRQVKEYEETSIDFGSELEDHKVSRPGLGGYLHAADGEDAICGGLLGGIATGVAAGAAGLALAPLAAVAAGGALLAGLGSYVGLHKRVHLQTGVNRFEGADRESRLQAASYAFNHRAISAHAEKVHHYEFGPGGLTRQQSLDLIGPCQDTRSNGRLAILTDRLGPEGEPAVVLVPSGFSYPVRNGESGLELPGKLIIPYDSIRGITDWSE